jgi:dihydropteroate synthase
MPPPLIMGILNMTPDSFYDGGRYDVVEVALAKAEEMAREGADIIDIGGESTGPGSPGVSIEEELERVMPVLKAMSDERLAMSISVDTYKAKVAKRALEAGATMINDVTGGRGDPAMFNLIAEAGCDYVLMHSKDDSPRTTVREKHYDDVIHILYTYYTHRLAMAESAGIARERIIIDPGLGHFVSSNPTHSWEILERLGELKDFGCRILVSPSRKSFTAEHPKQPPNERLAGTLRATKIATARGADIIRTHDVRETKAILKSQE